MDTYVERYRKNSIRERLKIGNTLYIVPNDTRHQPFVAEIINIGRKYIVLSMLHRTENKFSLVDLENVCDDGVNRYTLYEDRASYLHCCDMKQRHKKSVSDISRRLDYVDFSVLRTIEGIIDKIVDKNI